ncbi:hypothetical protein GCM10010440_70890 [Kitasatospora cinereorecta]
MLAVPVLVAGGTVGRRSRRYVIRMTCGTSVCGCRRTRPGSIRAARIRPGAKPRFQMPALLEEDPAIVLGLGHPGPGGHLDRLRE